ncbi:hypothetical protein U8527_02195 [Kordia algicida OT-1]|uniref:Uncharacterized protein n=1 Tax=Kordia algicida OT-1 TaxID=391587 RepID=A9DN60_9FLAO|nr:hypothetical protein [Kordia algicida]EDP97119.1 hypothetical protein KAOT1_18192 [Kordia algicida OT-1]
MEEYYFNLNLRNHTDEQLFHVELVNKPRQFAVMGKVDGYKQFWSGRYTITEIEFYIANFDIASQNIKIDEVIFEEMTSQKTVIRINCSDTDSDEIHRIPYNQVRLGVYKTELVVKMYNKENGSDSYLPFARLENFGGHICKSKITF